MDRHILFLVLLAAFLLFTVAIFAGAREQRLDVYISVFTIEYLALVEILRPRRKLISPLRLDPVTITSFISQFQVAIASKSLSFPTFLENEVISIATILPVLP